MKIDLNCAACGSNRFTSPEEFWITPIYDPRHRIGTMAGLEERVAAEVLKRSMKAQPLV